MNILLFTSAYPYGDYSEVFLTNELEVASKYCSIVILPIKKSNNCRVLPDNVKVDNCCNSQGVFFYFVVLFRMLFSQYFWGAILSRHFFNIKKNSQRFFFIKTLFGAFIIKTIIKERKIKFDEDTVFYSYWLTYAPLGLCMLKNEGFLSNRIISRAHSYEIDEDKVGFYFPLRHFTYKWLDQVFSISETGASILKKRYLDCAAKINVRKLGVFPIKEEQNILQKDVIHVVSCSGIRLEKRVPLIFDSLNEYCKSYPNIRLIWFHIGGGEGYNHLEEQTRYKVRNLHVNLLGTLDNREVLAYYKNSNFNIFINLSTREGVPVTIMEAISSSIPILATDVGATREIVTEETGVLLDKNFTQKEFNSGINYIIDNYDRLSGSTFRFFMKNYNAEKNYHEFYKSLR